MAPLCQAAVFLDIILVDWLCFFLHFVHGFPRSCADADGGRGYISVVGGRLLLKQLYEKNNSNLFFLLFDFFYWFTRM